MIMIRFDLKKILAVVLCLVMLFAFSSCGEESTAGTSSITSSVNSSKAESNVSSSTSSSAPVSSEAEKPVVTIMPLGDSLTQGGSYKVGDDPNAVKKSSGYRNHLSKMLTEGGYNTKFVGSHNWAPDLITDGNVMHSGYGGDTIFTLKGKLTEMKDCNPDIILLMIGRNDMTEGTSPTNYISFLDQHLMVDLYKMFPNAHIFIASIPVVRNHNNEELQMTSDTNYAPKIEEYVQQQKSKGAKVDFVDMRVSASGLIWEDFTAEDFVHPQPAGYEKIAKQWYSAITDKITEIAASKSK